MREHLTHKAGKFRFSEEYQNEKIDMLLAKAVILNETVRDLPILPDMVSQIETELVRQSIFGTAAIEGNPLSQEEVFGILESQENALDPVPKSKVEIHNLVKAYEILSGVKPEKTPFVLEESLLRELHSILTTGVPHEFNDPGMYRNEVVGYTEVGDKAHGGIYRPPRSLKDIQDLMKIYVEWVNSEELISKGPFIRAALAHYHFSLIHPFFDGNGRTARLIEAMILQGAHVRYVPKMLSNYYYRNLDDYYMVFSRTIRNKGKDVTPFLEFCLKGVVESLVDMKGKILLLIRRLIFRELVAQMKNRKELTVRQFEFLSLLMDTPQVFSLNDLMNHMPFSLLYKKVTKQTARRDVKRLLELGLIHEVEEGGYFLDLKFGMTSSLP